MYTATQRSRRVVVLGLATAGAASLAQLNAQVRPAGAAPGDAVRAGRRNEAGDAETSLRSSSAESTLRVTNRGKGRVFRADAGQGIAGVFYSRDLGISVNAARGLFIHTGVQAIDAISDKGIVLAAESKSSASAIVATAVPPGTAVVAGSYDGMGGYGTALDAKGRVFFKSAGDVVVPAGATGVDVTLDGTLATTSSIALATLQEPSGLSVRYAKVTGSSALRVELTGRTSKALRVGYFVFN